MALVPPTVEQIPHSRLGGLSIGDDHPQYARHKEIDTALNLSAIGDLSVVPAGSVVTLRENRHATIYGALVIEAGGVYVHEPGSLLVVQE